MRNRTAVLGMLLGALAAAPDAAGQPAGTGAAPLPKWDANAHFDLYSARHDVGAPCCDHWTHVLAGGAGLGFYWTPNVKTEIDLARGNEADHYVSIRFPARDTAFPPYRVGRRFYRDTTLSITQAYQFFRNTWFHPALGVGVDAQWAQTRGDFEPLTIFRPDRRVPEVLEPGFREPRDTDFRAQPFVTTGFKAYVTERAFLRMDLKLVPGGENRQVSWRTGFGVDF